MKLRDKNNSYYERRVVFMKNIIINNIDKITIGIGIFSIITLDLDMSTTILLSKIEGKPKMCYPEWMSLLINMVW